MSLNTFLRCLISFSKCWSLEHTLKALETSVYKKVIDNRFKNKSIIILKQDKGRGIVILDTNKYTKKCMALLNTERFKRLTTDPTAATERNIQRVLRKIKSNPQSKNTKDYTQQAQDQLDFAVQPRYTN